MHAKRMDRLLDFPPDLTLIRAIPLRPQLLGCLGGQAFIATSSWPATLCSRRGLRRLAHLSLLEQAQARLAGIGAGTEGPAATAPAPLLHARHREHGLTHAHEDGGVGDPVLLGAHQFLTIEDEDRPGTFVNRLQVGNRSGLAHFGIGERTPGDGLLKKYVTGFHLRGTAKRQDVERAVGHRRSHPKRPDRLSHFPYITTSLSWASTVPGPSGNSSYASP